ncbi:MAG: putative glycolipid-binding domain-containing protein [Thermomicrobiales bacterium]|nr:putative glycolipid-binding domain-containing protein [Thermomicrobiales bacterium]
MTSELIWQHLDTPGWEHVRVIADHPEWTVFDSIFVRHDADRILRGGYTLVMDKAWRTLELRLMLETSPGVMDALHLLTEGDGRWTDAEGRPMPQLDGCLDVDIRWTPLTNSLPINRLGLDDGDSADITVAYISLPDLVALPIQQTYSHTGAGDFRYTNRASGFSADIVTDADGYVISYPERFQRTFPG